MVPEVSVLNQVFLGCAETEYDDRRAFSGKTTDFMVFIKERAIEGSNSKNTPTVAHFLQFPLG